MFLTPTLGWVWLCGASDNKDSWPLISPVSFLLDQHLTGTTVSRASQYNEYGLNIRATHMHNLCSLNRFWWQPFRAYLFGTKGSLFSSWHFLGKSLLFYFFPFDLFLLFWSKYSLPETTSTCPPILDMSINEDSLTFLGTSALLGLLNHLSDTSIQYRLISDLFLWVEREPPFKFIKVHWGCWEACVC